MLVRCPSCNTTYTVADDVVKATAAVFRCSRCKHIFELEPKPRPKSAPPPGGHPTEKADQPELSFPRPEPAEEKTQRETDRPLAGEPAPPADAKPSGDNTEQWSMTVGDPAPEQPFTISQTSDTAAQDKVVDAPTEPQFEARSAPARASDNILSFDASRDQPVSVAPYLTLLALLVIFFSLFTAFHQAHPAVAENIVRVVPLIGAALLKNNHLKNSVALQSLRTSYQTIQGNREVFVVSGVAQNQNSEVIREVRVAGRIYDQEGKGIEQQTIWLGNAISAKIIRGMTIQDIADLQRLPPLKSFGIPPGDSVPFTIVFLKGTKGIKDFNCEVLSAEGEI